MGPVEFIKSCFIIVCVMISFAIYIKVSFALVDWLVDRIREATLKIKNKTITYGVFRIRKRILVNRKDIEEHEDEL